MLGDRDFGLILDRFDLDWEGYRRVRKGVKKRLRRRWIDLGVSRVEEFLAALDANPALAAECRRWLTVSVSRFWRDAELWRLLDREILPLFADHEIIRAWSAGCARGEEAYSLKIVHDQWRRRTGPGPDLEILATDINPLYLEQARAGVYGPGSLRQAPDELWTEYFRKAPGRKQWRVSESLKEGVRWRAHDLCSETAPGRFEFVVMRNNVLTYESPATRVRVLEAVLTGLRPGGFLIIGAKEDLPRQQGDLMPWPGGRGVFRLPPDRDGAR